MDSIHIWFTVLATVLNITYAKYTKPNKYFTDGELFQDDVSDGTTKRRQKTYSIHSTSRREEVEEYVLYHSINTIFGSEKRRACEVSIPNFYEAPRCKSQRLRGINVNRQFYKLTEYGEKQMIKFPLLIVPFLNQTVESVQFHTALDPVDSRWLVKFGAFSKVIIERFLKQLLQRFGRVSFTKESDYMQLFDIHNAQIKALHSPRYFSNPSLLPDFTEIIHNGRYKSDDIFVQKRLAGPCPFMLKLVTYRNKKRGFPVSELGKLLNPQYSWDSALQKALGVKDDTFVEALQEERVYILYHPENNKMQTIPDFYKRNLRDVTSPIAIFVRTRAKWGRRSGDLKVIAIQTDYKRNSQVYSPQSEQFSWKLAKSMVEVGDVNVCNSIWHLSHLHLSGSVYCTLFRSHLSRLHPLHQIMRYHCEGTTPQIVMAYHQLVTPKKLTDQLYSIGRAGFMNLTMTGFKRFRYGLLAYDNLLYAHGLDSKKLRYHPFRDDGKVIWSGFKSFAHAFVDTYYTWDSSVKQDAELQSFANQISSSGQGESYGGKANINGFPDSFNTKQELHTFIARFLWQIALHGAVNYPGEPWKTFVPLTPTKLYNSSNNNNNSSSRNNNNQIRTFKLLPDALTSIQSTLFGGFLGNFRVNGIFDYYNQMEDETLRRLVKRYHYYFHHSIQKLLAARNKKRKMNGEMGFQYLEPKWLTNSIHI